MAYLPAIFGLVGVVVGGVITAIVQFILMSRRISADVALAKQKFDFELKATNRKRKQDLAEEVLAGFFEFREIMHFLRSPMSYNHEGKTREKEDGESPNVSKAKDTHFVLLERREKHREKLADFFSKEYRMVAWFGNEAAAPFQDCNTILAEATAAASMLVRLAGQHGVENELLNNLQAKVWWTDEAADAMIQRINNAIANIETICRPILNEPQ